MIDQHNSLAEKFIKKGFWLYLFSFIIAPMGYIIKIIISWELTVSEVGILYGIISLVTLLSAYNDVWMTESLKHFIPQFITEKRYDKVKTILFLAFFIQIITSLLIAAFFFFWAEYISENYFKTISAKETIKVFAFFFIGINMFQTLSNFFMAIQDTFYMKIIDLVRMFFITLSVIYIFLSDLSSLLYYSYTWIIWLYLWVLFAIYVFYTKYYKGYLRSENILIEKVFLISIFKYASLVFIWASAGTILWQMDMQMILYLLGTESAGYYTNYLSIIWIPFMIIGPIFSFLFPVFSEMHSKKQYSKIKDIKQIFQSNFLLIWIMFNLFFFVFAEIIAYTLFWERFIQSWNILKYSILFLVFNFFLQINFNILAWIWRVKERVKIVFIAIIFNLIMNYLLITTIWIYWAALATWLWWLLIWILSEYSLWKKYHSSFDLHSFLKNIIVMWWISLWAYHFIIPFITWFSRWKTFVLLFFFFSIWLCAFCGINYSKLKGFLKEIKISKSLW